MTIIYHFSEDAAKIKIKQKCSDPSHAEKIIELTGYRIGQKGIVVIAPPLDGHVLVNPTQDRQTVDLTAAETEVTFTYTEAENFVFEMVEHDAPSGTKTVIRRINGEANVRYNPKDAGNPLDLTSIGYKFVACNDDDVSDPFKIGGSHEVQLDAMPGTQTVYRVHYQKITRPIRFYAIDSARYPQPADMAQFSLEDAKNNQAVINGDTGELLNQDKHPARVAETNKIAAINVDLYTLDDAPYKYYYVENATGEVSVYFWYRQKGQHELTVQYWDGEKAILSYSAFATKGEKLKLVAPEYLENGKYKRHADQKETEVVNADGKKNVQLRYEANYVTVTVQTSVDGIATFYDSAQVNKTDASGTPTGNLTLTPPNKTGYTLKGIAVGADGGQSSYPAGYSQSTGRLMLNHLEQDTAITYYYEKTSATEYQQDLTIQHRYNGYALAADDSIKVNLGEANVIQLGNHFDGYRAKRYQFTDGIHVGEKTDIIDTTISVTPTQKTGTLVIEYIRADGTIVLPGKDGEISEPKDKDNVLVKPGNGATLTGPDAGNGSVTVGGGNAVVTRPIDSENPEKGKENIKVPDGTVIRPDGTIVLPNGGGIIKPEDSFPDDVIARDYIVVTYRPNGGTGDLFHDMAKKNTSYTLMAADLFTAPRDKSFAQWINEANAQTYAADATLHIGEKDVSLKAK